MSRILIVDDERNVLAAFEEILTSVGYEVLTSNRAAAAIELLQSDQFDLAIFDIRMPGMNGLDALRQIKACRPKVPVIIMTGQGTMETAIEATKLGAFDYHLKPFEPDEMLRTIGKALEGVRLMKGHLALGSEGPEPAHEAIVGQSPGMQEVYKAIGRVAQTDATVLIRGESGTGKELVARAVYQHSRRSALPLLAVNCVAIPETLLESELFGYERGAFTGASARRIGKFEQADGGTLFLDEIGDIPPGIQAKILRVLQEKSFERLGGNETIHADVRVLTATNRPLERAIAEKNFREDLYHRLNVVTIRVPPLRERREDIPALVDYFLERFSRELGIAKPPVSGEAMDVLCGHPWPGNVRELEHCIHRVMIFTRGYPIQAADLALGPETEGGRGENLASSTDDELLATLVHRYLGEHGGERASEQFLDRVERLLIAEALRRTKGNQSHAARLLGVSRPTLHAKIEKHHLHDADR
ncbi:MAG: sigma-54-dependent transcriptional regulator [Pirellulales bacterium]